MTRAAVLVCGISGVLVTTAGAGPREDDRAMQLELGFNTRHFAADSVASDVAFRSTTGGETSVAAQAGDAWSSSLRFTGRTRYNTFVGVEAEFGELIGIEGSNLAGAYGVAGARGDLGPVRLAAELVAGRRWVRYDAMGREDATTMIAEPRLRADVWLAPKLTLGAAAGATLGDRSVWMAGVYIGVHSRMFDRL